MKKLLFSIFVFLLCMALLLSPLSVAATSSAPSTGEFMDTLESASALLIDLDTETVLYEKDPTLEVEPVFLTKLMVALLTLETIQSKELEASRTELDGIKITAPDEIFDELTSLGSSAPNIKRGETLSLLQLLNLLLVPSGNDAAMVLARRLGEGSIPSCVDKMNARAKQLGTTNTFFTNVHGFHDPEQITTVGDIYKITKPLLEYDIFLEIVATLRYRLEPTNMSDKARSYNTTNLMMDNMTGTGYYYQPIKGIKTGRTESSGFCFVSYAVKGNDRFFCVTMGAPAYDENGKLLSKNGAFKDTKALYSWAFANLELKTIVKEGDPISQIPIKYAWNQDQILLVAAENFSAILPKSVDPKSILLIPDVPKELEAPVQEGDVIGTADIMYAGKKIGTVNAIASASAEKNTMQVISDTLDDIFTSVWLYVGIGVIVLGLGIYALLFLIANHKNSRKVSHPRNRRRP